MHAKSEHNAETMEGPLDSWLTQASRKLPELIPFY
jgi:hypothetical protein